MKINFSTKQYDVIFTHKKVVLSANIPFWGTEGTWQALLCASVSAGTLITCSVGVSYLYFPGEITCVVTAATAYIYCGQQTHEKASWNLGKAQESKVVSYPSALFHWMLLSPTLPNTSVLLNVDFIPHCITTHIITIIISPSPLKPNFRKQPCSWRLPSTDGRVEYGWEGREEKGRKRGCQAHGSLGSAVKRKFFQTAPV